MGSNSASDNTIQVGLCSVYVRSRVVILARTNQSFGQGL